MNAEAEALPALHDLGQALLDAELLVGRGYNFGDGVGKLVQLHGEEVFQGEGLGVHVKVLSS